VIASFPGIFSICYGNYPLHRFPADNHRVLIKKERNIILITPHAQADSKSDLMFCGECGTQNPDTNQFCKNCGKPLKRPQQAPASQPADVPYQPPVAPPAAPQPAYYPPQQPGYGQSPVPPAGAAVTAKPPLNKGMLALGILGIAFGCVSFFFYPYLCGFAAILLGGISLFRTERKTGITGIIAIVALVIGLASIIIDHFYLVIFPPTMGFEVLCRLVI
jgi:hypothetical protein